MSSYLKIVLVLLFVNSLTVFSQYSPLFRYHIQRTMTLMETSSPVKRNQLKIVFYRQSIVAQDYVRKELEADLRTRYPYASFRRYIAQKYICELVEFCQEWQNYLDVNHLKPLDLLVDAVHLNDNGGSLMNEMATVFLEKSTRFIFPNENGNTRNSQLVNTACSLD